MPPSCAPKLGVAKGEAVIHPTAIIDPSAELDENVKVGAYSVIGAKVSIGAGSTIGPHVVIEGPTRIGRDNRIFQFASLGAMPQDKKYQGEETWLEIGDRNVIREFCTFNRGTVQDRGCTRIGDDNWIMAYCHIAHDCQIGNDTIFANNASLAGHVVIEDHVVLGGFALVYQFCCVGAYSICGFASGVKHNVPPYSTVDGMPAHAAGINREGLRRHQFSAEEIAVVQRAFRILYRENKLLHEARAEITDLAQEHACLQRLVDFLHIIDSKRHQQRGLIR